LEGRIVGIALPALLTLKAACPEQLNNIAPDAGAVDGKPLEVNEAQLLVRTDKLEMDTFDPGNV
jgi:hypothetical protein